MKFIIVFILCTLTITITQTQLPPTDNAGTTYHIEQVFKGRCWDYMVTKYIGVLPRVNASCDALWKSFFGAFSYQAPCAVPASQYDDFFTEARQHVPDNKTLFWSHTYRLAGKWAGQGQNFVTLEDTLAGYLVDGITWCGQSIDPGMNLTRCPDWGDCPSEASEAFWAGASTAFARQASGVVSVLLDGGGGSSYPSYERDSFLGKYEIPNLGQNVTSFRALISYPLGFEAYDVCDKGPLADLRDDVAKYGGGHIGFECIQNPAAVIHLMCVDDPSNKACQLVRAHASGALPVMRTTTTRRKINSKPPSVM